MKKGIIPPFHGLGVYGLALYIKVPAGQLGGKPHILPPPADGKGVGLVRHDDLHGRIVLVDDHTGYLCRGKRVADELGRVRVPGNDIDLFPFELLDHVLNPVAPDPHAGAHRVDIHVVGNHSDLGPPAGLPGNGLDGNDAFADFRHFRLEEIDHKIRMGPGQDNLGAGGLLKHFHHIGPHPVPPAVAFAGNLFPGGKNRLGLADIDNHVTALHAGDDTVDDLTLFFHKILVDRASLRLPHLLNDDLLGRLGRDTAEGLRVHLHTEAVSQFTLRIQRPALHKRDLQIRVLDGFDHLLELEYLNFAGILIIHGFNIDSRAIPLPSRRLDGLFKGLHKSAPIDALVPADLFYNTFHVLYDHWLTPSSFTSFALVISP